MAENANTENVEKSGGEPTAAAGIVETIEKMSGTLESFSDRIDGIDKRLEEAEKPRYPNGVPGSFGVRKGENIMASRGYSLMRLAAALRKRNDQSPDWGDQAKIELDLSNKLNKAYYQSMQCFAGANILVPLGSDLMPTQSFEVEDDAGHVQKMDGLPRGLVQECSDLMKATMVFYDKDEVESLQKRFGLNKDLSASLATTGGTLVGMPTQGELIELLRAQEVMSQVGAAQIDLPPQGKIRFPRITSGVTIAAYAEGATVSESTPGTSALELSAKAYSGLVDIPDELIRFATSVSVEAWLRAEFTRDLALQTTQDMISGAGGTAIQGVINFSGISNVTASTVGANGNTLDPEDPILLYANIADNNAPVDRGFFYAATNTLIASLMTRKASTSGEFMFNIASNQYGGGMINQQLNGHRIVGSTQIPTNRSKGSASNLTLLLGGVGSEWVIARAGVVELVMTNSDASKFQQRISTMRGTQYIDAGPRHEQSFGIIDTLLNS